MTRTDWSGDVVVCLRHRIQSDLPAFTGPAVTADAGAVEGESNPNGAISVRTRAGLLGARPSEIAWWHYVGSNVRFVWVRAAWMPQDLAEGRVPIPPVGPRLPPEGDTP